MKIAALSTPMAVLFTNHAAARPRYIGIELVKSDPQAPGPLARTWFEGPFLANAVIALAVAMVCFMMLTGRAKWKWGATVILGCFLLFGSAAIVTGIQSIAAMGR
jgi:type IV secretory pathway VirB2 component (pilin)